MNVMKRIGYLDEITHGSTGTHVTYAWKGGPIHCTCVSYRCRKKCKHMKKLVKNMCAYNIDDILKDETGKKFESSLEAINDIFEDDAYNSNEISAVYGKPKVGKSLFSIQEACKLSADGKNVLFVDTEGSIIPMLKKWIPVFEEIYGERKGKILVESKKSIENLMKYMGHLISLNYKSKSKKAKKGKLEFSVIQTIESEMENILKKEKIDFVILDSLTSPLRSFTKEQQNYPARCFSEDTKILTENGWLNKDEIKIGMNVLSINENRELEWKPITNIYQYDYDGDMLQIGNGTKMDLLVTPNHKMIAEKWRYHPWEKIKDFDVVEAQDLKYGHRLIRTGNWNEVGPAVVEIDELKDEKGKLHSKKSIDSDLFMKFLGLWLAEGSYGRQTRGPTKGKPLRLEIAQIKLDHKQEIRDILDELPFKYTEHKKGFTISDVQLATFIHNKLGDVYATSKFIPKEFKDFAKKSLNSLIDGFMIGDGSLHKGNKVLYTSSKKLMNDLSEIVIKCGYLVSIHSIDGGETIIKGKKYKRQKRYTLNLSEQRNGWFVRKSNNHMRHIDYNGTVWCPEVKDNHTIVANRNGKITMTGNSDATAFIMRTLVRFQEDYDIGCLVTVHATYNPANPYETMAEATGGIVLHHYAKRLLYLDKRQAKAFRDYRRFWLVRGENAPEWSKAGVAKIDENGYHTVDDESEKKEVFTVSERNKIGM